MCQKRFDRNVLTGFPFERNHILANWVEGGRGWGWVLGAGAGVGLGLGQGFGCQKSFERKCFSTLLLSWRAGAVAVGAGQQLGGGGAWAVAGAGAGCCGRSRSRSRSRSRCSPRGPGVHDRELPEGRPVGACCMIDSTLDCFSRTSWHQSVWLGLGFLRLGLHVDLILAGLG